MVACVPMIKLFRKHSGSPLDKERGVEAITLASSGAVEKSTGGASTVTKSTKSSSDTTVFVESHALPEQLFQVGRSGVRLSGDSYHANVFLSLLLDSNNELKSWEISVRLQQIGFTYSEAAALSEILHQFVVIDKTGEFSAKNLLPYFAYYFDKAVNTKSLFEFGFQVLDKNSDGEISKTELAEFLNLFWNKKIENILKTQCATPHLGEFMKKQASLDSFEFYMDMRKTLKIPYISTERFEELKEIYIKSTAEREINLSDSCKNEILSYAEPPEIAEINLVKTQVFRSAVFWVSSLLEQQVDLFTKQMLMTETVASDLFSTIAKKGEIRSNEFAELLVNNSTFAEFIADIRRLFLKALSISMNPFIISEQKKFLRDLNLELPCEIEQDC